MATLNILPGTDIEMFILGHLSYSVPSPTLDKSAVLLMTTNSSNKRTQGWQAENQKYNNFMNKKLQVEMENVRTITYVVAVSDRSSHFLFVPFSGLKC